MEIKIFMVDILLASYNGSRYIKEQIESIIAQTYKDWKLIIHDDQSLDKTFSIVQHIQKDFNKKMVEKGDVRYIESSMNKSPCKGAAANFCELLKSASSDYAMFCDQDDVWNPDKIEKSMILMHKMEKKYGKAMPLLVYTDLEVTDEKLHSIAASFMKYMKIPSELRLSRLLLQNSVTGCTILMNRPLYELLHQANDSNQMVMHDHFVALVAKVLGKAGFLPESTIKYRQHGNNSVGASDARSLSYLWQRYKRGKKQFRRDLYHSMIQAGYLYKVYCNNIKDQRCKKLIYDYSHLYKRTKIFRLKFYVVNRMLKYGGIRAFMQLIWG